MALTAPEPTPLAEPAPLAPAPGEMDLEGLRGALAEAAVLRGFTGAVYMHLGHGLHARPEAQAPPTPALLVATASFNEGLYLKRNYFPADPLARRALVALAPFAWTLDELVGSGAEGDRLCEAMAGWGMHMGLLAPVQDYARGPALLNLFAPSIRAPDLAQETGQLMLKAAELHLAAARLNRDAPAGAAELTGREMAVLRRAALGLTEGETAHELALSRRGVQFHLARAIEKLGATNKTAAVARAVSLGLIRL